jgi:hypothetical protein
MSLTKPALSELGTESDLIDLVNEWLALWFDGRRHAVGTNDPVLFPKVARKFGQSAASQPMRDASSTNDEVEIRLVVLPRMEVKNSNDSVLATGKLVTQYVLFNFWVKASKPGENQSSELAQRTAQLLKAILDNPDSNYALAEKGIRHLHGNMPQSPTSDKWAERLVTCSAQLVYAIKFGAPLVPVPNAADQNVIYYNESPLIAGEYLMGTYQWTARAQLVSAVLNGWPPQGQDVVLGLEVNGHMTNTTVTFPIGTANTDTEVDVTFADLFVNPNLPTRWKVLSAPAPEDSAWHISLNLLVKPQ